MIRGYFYKISHFGKNPIGNCIADIVHLWKHIAGTVVINFLDFWQLRQLHSVLRQRRNVRPSKTSHAMRGRWCFPQPKVKFPQVGNVNITDLLPLGDFKLCNNIPIFVSILETFELPFSCLNKIARRFKRYPFQIHRDYIQMSLRPGKHLRQSASAHASRNHRHSRKSEVLKTERLQAGLHFCECNS